MSNKVYVLAGLAFLLYPPWAAYQGAYFEHNMMMMMMMMNHQFSPESLSFFLGGFTKTVGKTWWITPPTG